MLKMNDNQNEVYIEMALGLGETLASANQQGSPYRFIFHKDTKTSQILQFANYSFQLLPSSIEGLKSKLY